MHVKNVTGMNRYRINYHSILHHTQFLISAVDRTLTASLGDAREVGVYLVASISIVNCMVQYVERL